MPGAPVRSRPKLSDCAASSSRREIARTRCYPVAAAHTAAVLTRPVRRRAAGSLSGGARTLEAAKRSIERRWPRGRHGRRRRETMACESSVHRSSVCASSGGRGFEALATPSCSRRQQNTRRPGRRGTSARPAAASRSSYEALGGTLCLEASLLPGHRWRCRQHLRCVCHQESGASVRGLGGSGATSSRALNRDCNYADSQ